MAVPEVKDEKTKDDLQVGDDKKALKGSDVFELAMTKMSLIQVPLADGKTRLMIEIPEYYGENSTRSDGHELIETKQSRHTSNMDARCRNYPGKHDEPREAATRSRAHT